MANSTSTTNEATPERDVNLENAAKLAQINHDNSVKQNVTNGYDGVQVREQPVKEVINPVRNSATGELQDDTRALKISDINAVTGKETDGEDSAKAAEDKDA